MHKVAGAISRAAKVLLSAYFLLAILVATALLVPRLVGLQPYAVLSGSMEPALHTGALAYAADGADFEVGDIIVFSTASGTPVAHRAIAIDESTAQATTKGDANETPDPAPVPPSAVIGPVRFSISILGFLATWAETNIAAFAAFQLAVIVVLSSVLALTRKAGD